MYKTISKIGYLLLPSRDMAERSLKRRILKTTNQLGIEFYLFVSHGAMNDRGSTCKVRNARSAVRILHVDPLSFIIS